MSEGSDIWGRRRRLLRRDDRPYELATTIEASAEEDDPKVSMETTEVSIEEAEDTTSLSEHIQRQRGQCVFTGSLRYRQRQRRSQLIKQKIKRV